MQSVEEAERVKPSRARIGRGAGIPEESGLGPARVVQERFRCNRGFAAVPFLTAPRAHLAWRLRTLDRTVTNNGTFLLPPCVVLEFMVREQDLAAARQTRARSRWVVASVN